MEPIMKKFCSMLAWSLVLCCPANAVIIVGGSDLLSPAEADFIANSIPGRPAVFTNIFDYKPGDTAQMFLAAAGKTAGTVTVVEATANDGTVYRFGGYNPLDWSGPDGYRRADTAFLFSLTRHKIYPNWTGIYDPNDYAVYVTSFTWPSFGGGRDLYLGSDATPAGYSQIGFSYEAPGSEAYTPGSYTELAGQPNFIWTKLEVFAVGGAVPEPSTWAMMLTGFTTIGAGLRMRKKVALSS
jgi:hypothetical protein